MSAPESAAVVPPVETETPVVKAEEPPAVVDAEVAAPAVETEAEPAAEPAVEDSAKEVKDDAKPKSPNFLAKLFSNLKVTKAPKSPKKEKKEEVEAPTEEAPKVPAAEAPPVVPEVPVEVVETDKATETTAAVPEVVVPEEAKEQPAHEIKALKLSRRISARVGDFFKGKPKTDVATPAKVDELPPKIDEPVPVAPLENPASGAPKVEEPSKPVEVAPPVVAAAA